MNIWLRPVEPRDIPRFFEFHCDQEARHAAAFGTADPPEPEAFAARWRGAMEDPAVIERTILADHEAVGYAAHFPQLGRPSVSYWIGRAWWGRGIATQALGAFLPLIAARPLYARAAKDNFASLRVLEKNGFRRVGEDRGFAALRGCETEDWIFSLG